MTSIYGYLPIQRELSCVCSLLPSDLLPRLSPRLKIGFFYQVLEGANALHNARTSPLVHQI